MLALALQAAMAFNLVCTGTYYLGEMRGLGLPEDRQPFRAIIRVDLRSQRWCIDDCQTTSRLLRVSDTLIVFHASEDSAGDNVMTANRENGAFLDRMRLNAQGSASAFISMRTGTCERAPFTGFPQRRF